MYLGDTIQIRKQIVSVDSQTCRVGFYQSNGEPIFGHRYYNNGKLYRVVDFINRDTELSDFVNLYSDKFKIPKVDSLIGQANSECWIKDDSIDLDESKMTVYKIIGDSVTVTANYSEVSGPSWWMHIVLLVDEGFRYISDNKTEITFYLEDSNRLETREVKIMCLVAHVPSVDQGMGYVYTEPMRLDYLEGLVQKSKK